MDITWCETVELAFAKHKPRVTFDQKKLRLQKFYDEWIKPIKDNLSPNLSVALETMIEEYSLTK